MKDRVLKNVVAENSLHLNNTPVFIRGLLCLASRLYDMLCIIRPRNKTQLIKAQATV